MESSVAAKYDFMVGNGCGDVGRSIASDTSSNPVLGNFWLLSIRFFEEQIQRKRDTEQAI